MIKKKKLTTIAVGVLAMGACGFFSYTSLANEDPRVSLLESKKAQEAMEKKILESMPNKTSEEMDKTVEQGKIVKELGNEVAKLKEETGAEAKQNYVNLLNTFEEVTKENLQYYKDHIQDKPEYKTYIEEKEYRLGVITKARQELESSPKPVQELKSDFLAKVNSKE